MFIDASAIVAILKDEPGSQALEACIERCAEGLTIAPTVRFEAVVAIARDKELKSRTSPANIVSAGRAVDQFLERIGAVEIAITPEIGRAAIAASARFGKVVGHPAALNFGDCLAYACASLRDEALLFVGNDFSRTDVKIAVAR